MAISQRLSTPELLFRQATKMGLQPTWLKPNGPFAINTPSGERYVNYAASSLNPHIGVSLAQDKSLTRTILGRHGLPNIPYLRPVDLEEAAAFLAQYHKIIVKPYNGSGAKDVSIVEWPEQLTDLRLEEYILEEYIAGREMRYLVLDGAVIGVHESRYGVSVAADRDLERISYERAEWNVERMALALKAAAVLGLQFAAVDFLVTPEDRHYLLEVNTRPGLKWFHQPTSGPRLDVASLFLDAMLA